MLTNEYKRMKNSYRFQNFARGWTARFALAVCVFVAARLCAGEPQPAVGQRQFPSAEAATKALIDAAKAGDRAAIHDIFGPEGRSLMTGDEVQDKANFQGFSEAVSDACVPVPEGDGRVTLNIGTNNWPFPIPLVKSGGQWFFDTDAGREEIINRHIGMDELYAIGVCRTYVNAQREYFSKDRDGSGVRKYATKFKSTPGTQDGLYWDPTNGPSPFGALVAEAHAEGYGHNPNGSGPHPFHGYLFRILTSQGGAAPGGKVDYTVNGNLTGGFALVAYPEQWDKSGVMTFIVNQDGKVYERNLGDKTARIAAKMSRYNPESNWTPVSEPGIAEADL
jgi:hypothetical protein